MTSATSDSVQMPHETDCSKPRWRSDGTVLGVFSKFKDKRFQKQPSSCVFRK